MPVGTLRFLVPEPERLTQRAVEQAYLTGLDPVPSCCRARMADGQLLIERDGFESSKLNLPWRVDGRGDPLVATSTLIQRDRPYLLPVELARGKINMLRNQLAEWTALGLVPNEEVKSRLSSATRLFAASAVSRRDEQAASRRAQEALSTAFEAADALSQCFVEQALEVRHRTAPKLPVAFGASLGRKTVDAAAAPVLASLCNTAVIPMLWSDVAPQEDHYEWEPFAAQIEWCRSRSINAAPGPLVRLDQRGFPGWLALWQGDLDGILAFTAEYVSNVVRKFRGHVALWHVASYVHSSQALGLKDEDKLRVIVRAIETARRNDPDVPLIVSFDQPGGEYLRQVPMGYAPIHVADHLIRSGLPIAALGLELEFGYLPDGTYPRDPLEISRLIDLWAMLGTPLYIYITVPSGEGPDAKAESRFTVAKGSYHGGWSPETQARWVREFVPMLLAKSSVQGIAWTQRGDDEPHDLPHGGLFDAAGAAKPAVAALAALRKQHLQ